MITGSTPAARNAQPRGGAPHGPDSKRITRPSVRGPPLVDPTPATASHHDGADISSRLHGTWRATATITAPPVTANIRATPATRKHSTDPRARARPMAAAITTKEGTMAAVRASSNPRPRINPPMRRRVAGRPARPSTPTSAPREGSPCVPAGMDSASSPSRETGPNGATPEARPSINITHGAAA